MSGNYHPDNAGDYRQGQIFGNTAAVLQGVDETSTGGALTAGSAYTLAGSGGASWEVSVPGMVIGAGMTAHGPIVLQNALRNMARDNGKGQRI